MPRRGAYRFRTIRQDDVPAGALTDRSVELSNFAPYLHLLSRCPTVSRAGI
ncbi:hypothetical protein EYZ11_007033 [Aspergillus tanneri]|uniref:Uncharacterized protein n=1 Tax=Aspergillus tanneri TaxID=1220188 RepID=A0A4S3JG84_9EURO|nr:hypothetical protein EYZ11_007033 [Aspergillus tanneri]